MFRSISMSVWLCVCGGFMMFSLLRKRDFFMIMLFFLGLSGGDCFVSLFSGCVFEVDFCFRFEA